MYHYTAAQWILFFFVYCLIGWCFESTYVSLKKRRFVNRGFMYGPFLPLYGSGAIMMLVVSAPFQDNLAATYFAGLAGATILEYVTGVVMEALFKVRYWDYSNQKIQFQGHICLTSSLAWGALTIFMTHVIHKPIENVVLALPLTAVNIVAAAVGIIAAVDFSLSFKAAMDLRTVLVKLEKAKEEMVHLRRRLDVMIALANEENQQRKEQRSQKMEEKLALLKESAAARREASAEKRTPVTERVENIQRSIEEALAGLKERFGDMPENLKKEVGEAENEYSEQLDKRSYLVNFKHYIGRSILRRNPGMVSVKFKESMEEIKAAAVNRRARRDKDKGGGDESAGK